MLCRYMLTEHGVFPHEIINLDHREKLLMKALIDREAKEREKIKNKR